MKKSLIFLLITFITIVILSGFNTCYAAAPSTDYQLLLNDEFDGESLNTDIWDYRSGNPYGGKNLKENVRVENGKLMLDYRIVDGYYTGGGVLTNFNLPYGYYETYAKVFGETGRLHTSFWLSGGSAFTTRPENFPQNNSLIEIDGFEIDSEKPNAISHGIHYWWGEHVSASRWNYSEIDTSKEWFTMGMEWLPDRVNFYINGQLVNSDTELRVYGPSYLWLTAVAMPEGKEHLIDDSKVNGSSEFEYFRYYQKPLKNVNLLGNGNLEYDRLLQTTKFPHCFITKGDTNAAFSIQTPYAYDGFCSLVHTSATPYSVSTGQEFPYLCAGNYTFRGMFKSTGGHSEAKMVVFNKNGAVIAEKNIPACAEWTEFSITDIPITQYAYVAIVSASDGDTVLLADDLSFFCQEGESYTALNTPDYENYVDVPLADQSTIDLDDATSKSDGWSESSLMDRSYWTSASGAYAEWSNFQPPTADEYELQVYNIVHESNTPTQKYIVTINGQSQEIILDTKNGESGWVTLTKQSFTPGDIVHIRAERVTSGGNMRIATLRYISTAEKECYNIPALQCGNGVFTYQGRLYAFDRLDTGCAPYYEEDTLYIPYNALKDITGITVELPDQPGAENQTILTLDDAVSRSDNWLPSSLMKSSYYAASKDTTYAQWTFSPSSSGTYSLDAYNLIHTSNAQSQKYTVTLNGVSQSYIIDTINGSSKWTSLGKYDLTPSDTLTIRLENNGNSGYMRTTKLLLSTMSDQTTYVTAQQIEEQNAIEIIDQDDLIILQDKNTVLSKKSIWTLEIRLAQYSDVFMHPTSAKLMGTEDVSGQIIYGFDAAEKTGNWTYTTLHGGSYYAGLGSPAPSVAWKTAAPASGRYSVQIFSPTHTNSTEQATVFAYMNNQKQSFYLNQQQNPGWYDLGIYDLQEGNLIYVQLSHTGTGGLLRASSIRLVPCPEITTSKIGQNVTINAGYAYNYADAILYAVYDGARIIKSDFLTPAEKMTFQLPSATNKYRVFFWESMETMRPVFPARGNK